MVGFAVWGVWGYVLCDEADEEALWLASLLKSGCGYVGTVLCGEADEEALWLASLCGGGCVEIHVFVPW